MAPSKRSRERQTRLTFTPLPSSSPAAKGYNKQIQDRAAAVSLDSSPGPAKRHKISDEDVPQFDGGNDPMPTPAASALRRQPDEQLAESDESDSEPVRSTQRRPGTQDRPTLKGKAKQQRLDWSNVREPDSFSSPVRLSSPSRPQSSARPGVFGTQRPRAVIDVSSDESDELPSPAQLKARSKNKRKAGAIRTKSAPVTRSTQLIVVDTESEGENIVVNSEPANRIVEEDDEDESDDMPTTQGKQKRKRARRGSHNSFISSSPPRVIDSDDDLEIIDKPRKRMRGNESEEDESEVETPKWRLKPKRVTSKRERDELAEDLDFLGPSSEVDEARKPRDTQSVRKDARQQALEKLKRQRSGKQTTPDEDEEVEEVVDEGSEEEDDDADYTADYIRENTSRQLSRAEMFNEDDYDQDFIEEDNDDTLGVPDGIPLEFTRYASMKPKELFKHAVEWMVQKKINPAFEMKDGLYDLAFRKLDDEVKGLAGSKFTSAAWTPEFTVALKSRPDIAFDKIDRNADRNWMRDKCDACNRSNHPASYEIQFQGRPYHRQTLEELPGNGEEDEDSSSDEDDSAKGDQPDWDASGQHIPPENTIFYVGKFCKSNAETAHALQHWRYHLNEWVVNWLNKEGYYTDELVVKRDKLSTKKRRKEANRITDVMEAEGVIKVLWKDFYGNINDARNSKQGRYRGESP